MWGSSGDEGVSVPDKTTTRQNKMASSGQNLLHSSMFSSSLLARAQARRPAFGFRGLHFKVVFVGGGTGSVTVAAQLQRAFAIEKRALGPGDLAIVEGARKHYCE
jgi:hypothetical protein